MANAYYAVYEHIVFSTKERIKWIDDDVAPALYSFLSGTVRAMDCKCLIVGGHRDHVHLLVRKKSTLLTPSLIKEIKRTSSPWMKSQRSSLRAFRWQIGYGAFSVSYDNLNRVASYIQNQATHHRKMTWEEEYRRILKKAGVEYDERYFLD